MTPELKIRAECGKFRLLESEREAGGNSGPYRDRWKASEMSWGLGCEWRCKI